MTMRASESSYSGARVLWLLSLFLTAGAGIGAGWIMRSYRQPSAPLAIREDARPPRATVHLHGIRNGALEGEVTGDVSLVIGGESVVPGGSGAFSYADAAFLVNRIEVEVPPGMQFVASKRGTRFYPVQSAQGANIVPENRLYFPDAAAARAAGLRAWND